jgi:acyl-coenzyme A synthetase/AMP-(fatty) acid ligase
MSSRGICCLLPPDTNPRTIESLAQEYPVNICATDSERISVPKGIEALSIESVSLKPLSGEVGNLNIARAQPAIIAFTSGSTGKPSANIKNWNTIAETARSLSARFGISGHKNHLIATVPSQHMYGLETSIFMALTGGFVSTAEKPFYPLEIVNAIESTGCPSEVTLVTTPFHLKTLLDSGLNLPKINQVISATAPLSNEIALQTETKLQAPVFEIYGCTECGSLATRRTLENQQWTILDDFSLSQIDDSWYAHADHLPEQAKLSDQFELLDDRHFLLKGRNSDLINVAGKRASLADLTMKLQSLPYIEDAAVIIPQNSRRKIIRPVALVVSESDVKQISVDFAKLVDSAFVPRPIIKVDKLPRNGTGKITQKAIETLLREHLSHDH